MNVKLVQYVIIVAGALAAGISIFYAFPRYKSRPTFENMTPDQLRPLIDQDQPVESRAAAIEALGLTEDWSSIPVLLEICDDPNPLIRGRAGVALQRIIGADYQFRADDPPNKRQKAIETMRFIFDNAGPPPIWKPSQSEESIDEKTNIPR